MAMMSIAVLSIPVLDCIAKILAASLSVGEIAWARFTFQALVLLPFFLVSRSHDKQFNVWYLGLGLCMSSTILFLFWGLKYLPLATNIALFFVEPLLLMVFAGVFLGEKITRQRWGAVLAGFAGAIIIIRPSWTIYGVTLLLPLASAACYAAYLAATRAYNNKSGFIEPITLQFWVSVSAALVLSLFLVSGSHLQFTLFSLSLPTGFEWSLLLISGVVAVFGHILITLSLKNADASILAPFQYLEIFGATLLGWMIFIDIPDRFTVLGALVIISSGFYLFLHERS